MTQPIIKKDSPFEFFGNHLEVAYRRGELLGYKKALLELTKMETKLEQEINKVYPQIRTKIIDATKQKIVEVAEEPIIIDKEGVAQPLDWLKDQEGL